MAATLFRRPTKFPDQDIVCLPMACLDGLDSFIGGEENADWVDQLRWDYPFTSLGFQAWEYLRYIERYVANGPSGVRLTQQTTYLIDEAGHLQEASEMASQRVDDVYLAQNGTREAMALLTDINTLLIPACAAIVKMVFIKAGTGTGEGIGIAMFTRTTLGVALTALDWLYRLSEVSVGGFVYYAAQKVKLEKALDPLTESVLGAMRVVLNGDQEVMDRDAGSQLISASKSTSPATVVQVTGKEDGTGRQTQALSMEDKNMAVGVTETRASSRKRRASDEPSPSPQARATIPQRDTDRPARRRKKTRSSNTGPRPQNDARDSLPLENKLRESSRKKTLLRPKDKNDAGDLLGIPDWFEGRLFTTVWTGDGNGRRVALSDRDGALVRDVLGFFASRDDRSRGRRAK